MGEKMSNPLGAETVAESLIKWHASAVQISNELSDKESKGWRGDSKQNYPSESFIDFVDLRNRITAWCDTGGCTFDPKPLINLERMFLQRLRLLCRDDFEELDQLIEKTIPSGEVQVQILNEAFEAVFRMLAVAQSQMRVSSRGSAKPSKGTVADTGERLLDLEVDETLGTIRRSGFETLCQLNVKSSEWHWFKTAWRAGDEGASQAQLENGYTWKKSGRRGAKSRTNVKLSVLCVAISEGFPIKIVEKTET